MSRSPVPSLTNFVTIASDATPSAYVSRLEIPSNLFKEQLNALAGKQGDLTKLEILRIISRFN